MVEVNMRIKLLLSFLVFLLSLKSFALLELGADFSYDRNVFGADRQSKHTSRSWRGSIAAYLWQYTALEFNYSNSEDETIIRDTVEYTDLSISILGQQTTIETKTYGVGIRQAFSSRKALIQPSISLGYAKSFKKTTSDYTIRDDSNNAVTTSVQPSVKSRRDSMFGTFSLKLRLSKRFGIRGSVQTYINAFDWNGAKDDLRYTVGLTWLL